MAGAPGQLYSAMSGLHRETGRLDGEARGAMLHVLESCACVFLCLFLAACLGGPGDGNGFVVGLISDISAGHGPRIPGHGVGPRGWDVSRGVSRCAQVRWGFLGGWYSVRR